MAVALATADIHALGDAVREADWAWAAPTLLLFTAEVVDSFRPACLSSAVPLAEALMEAEVSAQNGAGYGERSPSRTTQRNGYRRRRWDVRVGTVELAIPKLREGSYFPTLLEARRRSERAAGGRAAGKRGRRLHASGRRPGEGARLRGHLP